MLKKVIIGFAVALLLISAIFYGCGKVVQEGTGGGGGGTSILSGVVRDSSNNVPLSGVMVSSGNNNMVTNVSGNFTISAASSGDKAVATYSKDGYAISQKNYRTNAASAWVGDVYLVPTGISVTINAVTGGDVTDPVNNTKVNIPANGLVDSSGVAYSGNATVKLTGFDPSNERQLLAFPGDFTGLTSGGIEKSIETFGFMNIEIQGGGGTLNLAPGKSSTIEIPVPASMQSNAPATIPLWFFDKEKGIWVEEGTATLNGSVYQGTVNHYSNWNADMVDDTAYLIGQFKYALTLNPVEGVRVVANGIDYAGSSGDFTDKYGRFKVAVKANAHASVVFFSPTYSGTVYPNTNTPGPGMTKDLGVTFFPPANELSVDSQDLTAYFPTNPLNQGHITNYEKRMNVFAKGSLAHVEKNGATWGNKETITTQPTSQIVSQSGPDGSANVCYIDPGGMELATKSSGGNWNISTIDDNSNIPYNSFTIDSNGKPHVVYYAWAGGTQYNLYYATKNLATWTVTALDSLNSDLAAINALVTGISVATSSSGKIGVAYSCYDKNDIYGNHYLKYAEFDGSNWTVSTIKNLSGVGFTFWTASLAFSGDQPIIAAAVLNDSLRLYSRDAGGVWSDQLVESATPGEASILFPSLAIDSAGNPNIAYASYWQKPDLSVNYLLKYAKNSGSTWNIYVINSYAENEIPLSIITLRMSSDNKLQILWVSQGTIRLEEGK